MSRLLVRNSIEHIQAVAMIDTEFNIDITEARGEYKSMHPGCILEEDLGWQTILAGIETRRSEAFMEFRDRVIDPA